MKLHRISWFDEFECMGGACPQSCCKGWQIPLTDEDCERFKKERGRRGLSLFMATGGWTRDKFNADSGSCPFWGKDGLCRLQKEKGHDFIPETCRDYPRFYRNYGEFEETFLDLSCIKAAELFIKHIDDISLDVSDGEAETGLCTTNDDVSYLEFLVKTRDDMTAKAVRSAGDGTLGAFADELFSYACDLQDHYACGSGEAPPKPSKLTDYDLFPLPLGVLEKLLNSSFRHFRLKLTSPALYGMISKCDDLIRRCRKGEINWEDRVRDAFTKNAGLIKVCAAYLSYYLYMHFLRTYETYSFRKQVGLGICHMNMILFIVMSTTDPATITGMQLAGIIASYNGRAYFNDNILDEMYRIFEDHCRDIARLS